MKKIFAIGAALLALLLATPALAQVYAPGMMGNAAAQNQQQLQSYMTRLSQGNLLPDDQTAMYQLMQGMRYQTFGASGVSNVPAGNMMYFQKPVFGGPFNGVSGQAAWFGLMFIITVALVWVVLLLLVWVLWHWLKKHKH